MRIQRKDFYIVSVIGFLVGWLALLPAQNIGMEITPSVILFSVVGFTLFAPCALFLFKLLSKTWGVFAQFGKFAAVGTLNTLLDIGVLNLLIIIGGIQGASFMVFKTISFLVATTNSYGWNKFWIFQNDLPAVRKEYGKFLFFTCIGMFINVSIATFLVSGVGPVGGVGEEIWANIAALIAVFVSLVWNFLSYKHIVFKRA